MISCSPWKVGHKAGEDRPVHASPLGGAFSLFNTLQGELDVNGDIALGVDDDRALGIRRRLQGVMSPVTFRTLKDGLKETLDNGHPESPSSLTPKVRWGWCKRGDICCVWIL